MERLGGGPAIGGIAGWLIARLRPRPRAERRLELLERIALAPRQSLALVEAEGRKILVATSAEGGPSFYPLEERHTSHAAARANEFGARRCARRGLAERSQPRISW
jgi:flagellar biogenesis protein FliO